MYVERQKALMRSNVRRAAKSVLDDIVKETNNDLKGKTRAEKVEFIYKLITNPAYVYKRHYSIVDLGETLMAFEIDRVVEKYDMEAKRAEKARMYDEMNHYNELAIETCKHLVYELMRRNIHEIDAIVDNGTLETMEKLQYYWRAEEYCIEHGKPYSELSDDDYEEMYRAAWDS